MIQFCEWCRERGIKIVTAFGFSTENWKRPQEEVSYLMALLEKGLQEGFVKRESELHGLGVKIRVVGQRERLPESLQKVIHQVEERTEKNTNLFLNLAVSYGGRWDIVQAVQKIIKAGISPEQVTEEVFSQYLSTVGLPDPDLVIRAGGEKRFSNFVLWQAAYAELYFCSKYWPDFTKQDLDDALEVYAARHRRFGK